jgi:threonine dehydrogenase-like Zn-dependent dehydrogenase
MKVAKLYSFNDIRIEDVAIPEAGPCDALMKTRASGICSGDVMTWYIEKKAPLVLGHEPAGEIVELGSAFRTPHSAFSVGDRVFVHHHAPCLTCRHCRRGNHVQCETWKKAKIVPGGISEFILIPEINLTTDTLKLSEKVSFEDGTLIEPTACVLKGLKRAGFRFENKNFSPKDTPLPDPLPQGERGQLGSSFLREEKRDNPTCPREERDNPTCPREERDNPTCPPHNLRGGKEGLFPSLDGNTSLHFPSIDGNPSYYFPSLEGRGEGEGDVSLSDRTVLVIGLGVMGQLNILVTRRFGAGRIIGADKVDYRLKKAREFGADEVIDVSRESLVTSLKELTNGEMADLVIVGPNSVEAMQDGLSAAGRGGTVLLFTPAKPGEKLLIDPNYLYFNDISIVTSYSCGPVETREALMLIEEGTVSGEKLITHRFPIEKTAEAFRLTAEARDSLKVVITF